MLNIEKLSDVELDVLQAKYQQLRLDCVENEGADTTQTSPSSDFLE
jgi:hypothetical protein